MEQLIGFKRERQHDCRVDDDYDDDEAVFGEDELRTDVKRRRSGEQHQQQQQQTGSGAAALEKMNLASDDDDDDDDVVIDDDENLDNPMLNEPGPSEVLLRRDPTHRYQSRNHVRSWRERAENDRSCHCI